MTPCPNCDHDVTGHFAAVDCTVMCVVDGCRCVDWKMYKEPRRHAGRDANGNCLYANDHDGPCVSPETRKLERDAQIRSMMKRGDGAHE
jgi:hypothetical protein